MTSWIEKLNHYGAARIPCFFLLDYAKKNPLIFPLDELPPEIAYTFSSADHAVLETTQAVILESNPISFALYRQKLEVLKEHIRYGDIYLANLTQPTKITLQTTLDSVYASARAPFKLLVKDKFVCFSPEPFLSITKDVARVFPMKGTIEDDEGAQEALLNDPKELAEHVMVVDLLRNDLGILGEGVVLESFRYFSKIGSPRGDLWQTSSAIRAHMPKWQERLGTILDAMTPAGSITGVPKKKCCEILEKVEAYERGYFTGIAAVFDGESLRSFVLIRFIEQTSSGFWYKSGGGITLESRAKDEYEEMLRKIYVPIF